MKKLLLLFPLILLIGCSPSVIRNAYLFPSGDCGYRVYIGAPTGFDKDVPLSKCMPLKDATDLAAQINKDIVGKWSAER